MSDEQRRRTKLWVGVGSWMLLAGAAGLAAGPAAPLVVRPALAESGNEGGEGGEGGGGEDAEATPPEVLAATIRAFLDASRDLATAGNTEGAGLQLDHADTYADAEPLEDIGGKAVGQAIDATHDALEKGDAAAVAAAYDAADSSVTALKVPDEPAEVIVALLLHATEEYGEAWRDGAIAEAAEYSGARSLYDEAAARFAASEPALTAKDAESTKAIADGLARLKAAFPATGLPSPAPKIGEVTVEVSKIELAASRLR
ncbi:MAG: hypothetical protein U1E45_07610 [Geminicoccaceae bacterium]